MPITIAIFFFLSAIQLNRQRIVLSRITGNAMPIKEKNAVRSGDTYHAGKESKSRKMDIIVTARRIAFIIFLIIVV